MSSFGCLVQRNGAHWLFLFSGRACRDQGPQAQHVQELLHAWGAGGGAECMFSPPPVEQCGFLKAQGMLGAQVKVLSARFLRSWWRSPVNLVVQAAQYLFFAFLIGALQLHCSRPPCAADSCPVTRTDGPRAAYAN